jgi:hypothetical protein
MLTEGDSLALLGLCDVVDVASTSAPVVKLRIAGRLFGLGMTPYGQAIPKDVRGSFFEIDAQTWFTHHDVAFDGRYPGAVPPFAIEGCDIVVNGHIHKTQAAITAGKTRWTNPGNITRQSIDLADHVPRAWILGPDGELEPQALPFDTDVFDMTGHVVEAADGRAVAGAVESAFVSLLRAEVPADIRRSDDGSILREEIEAKFVRDASSDGVRAIVRLLLGEAVERHMAKE